MNYETLKLHQLKRSKLISDLEVLISGADLRYMTLLQKAQKCLLSALYLRCADLILQCVNSNTTWSDRAMELADRLNQFENLIHE